MESLAKICTKLNRGLNYVERGLLKMKNEAEKIAFGIKLKQFAATLTGFIAKGDDWTIRGFIDIFKNIYTISSDTKIVSKVLELHLFPHFLSFAENIGYDIKLATFQNWYPDLTFICKKKSKY